MKPEPVRLALVPVCGRLREGQYVELEIAERGQASEQILKGRFNAALGAARTGVGADESYPHAIGLLKPVEAGSAQRRRRSARKSQPNIGTKEKNR